MHLILVPLYALHIFMEKIKLETITTEVQKVVNFSMTAYNVSAYEQCIDCSFGSPVVQDVGQDRRQFVYVVCSNLRVNI